MNAEKGGNGNANANANAERTAKNRIERRADENVSTQQGKREVVTDEMRGGKATSTGEQAGAEEE